MDLDQITAFEKVVREGSFSRAAVALGIGQPAVSSRIQALEEDVGGILFNRGRRISLTPMGEGFLPYARRVLEVLREGVDAARMAQSGERGRVKLGALGSLAGGLVGPALAKFMRTHPEIDCTLRSADHEFLVELLLDGIVELALVTWPCGGSVEAELTPLFVFREPVVLVAHPRHELALRRSVTPDDVARLARPLLQLRWWQKHHPQIARLAQRSQTAMEVPMETGRYLVLQGSGAGFFTRTYIAGDLLASALAEIPVRGFPPLTRTSALVRRKRSMPLTPAAAALIQALRVEADRLTPGPSRKTLGLASP
jgi:LysR family transcriptional regulator, low CO2-responsive transcriptional regulator